MRVLPDTNILTRAAQPGHPMYREAATRSPSCSGEGMSSVLFRRTCTNFGSSVLARKRKTAMLGVGEV